MSEKLDAESQMSLTDEERAECAYWLKKGAPSAVAAHRAAAPGVRSAGAIVAAAKECERQASVSENLAEEERAQLARELLGSAEMHPFASPRLVAKLLRIHDAQRERIAAARTLLLNAKDNYDCESWDTSAIDAWLRES